jgi:predicted nucleic acid-binding protein
VSQNHYVETSALLRLILEGDDDLRPLVQADTCYTSALTLAEARRAVRRARSAGRLDAAGVQVARRRISEFERAAESVPVNEEVLERTGQELPIEPVRTLDAIHLATLQILGEVLPDLDVVSTDDRVRENARALGFEVVP